MGPLRELSSLLPHTLMVLTLVGPMVPPSRSMEKVQLAPMLFVQVRCSPHVAARVGRPNTGGRRRLSVPSSPAAAGSAPPRPPLRATPSSPPRLAPRAPQLVHGTYPEYAAQSFYCTPHLVIALDAGVAASSASEARWGATLELLARRELQACFTERNEADAHATRAALRQAGYVGISAPQVNPFRQPRVRRSPSSSHNFPCYKNCFVLNCGHTSANVSLFKSNSGLDAMAR